MGVAVPSLEKALTTYQELFGYTVYSGPFDDPVQRVSVCFLETGDLREPTLELVAPNGKDSPVDQVLKKGIGAYHLCYEVNNIEGALDYARSRGCIVISAPVPAVAFEGRRIAWFYTPTRQLIELVEQ
jgi:methylmalonyl-CoA/ethylmalonyl-CoA epimerase